MSNILRCYFRWHILMSYVYFWPLCHIGIDRSCVLTKTFKCSNTHKPPQIEKTWHHNANILFFRKTYQLRWMVMTIHTLSYLKNTRFFNTHKRKPFLYITYANNKNQLWIAIFIKKKNSCIYKKHKLLYPKR